MMDILSSSGSWSRWTDVSDVPERIWNSLLARNIPCKVLELDLCFRTRICINCNVLYCVDCFSVSKQCHQCGWPIQRVIEEVEFYVDSSGSESEWYYYTEVVVPRDISKSRSHYESTPSQVPCAGPLSRQDFYCLNVLSFRKRMKSSLSHFYCKIKSFPVRESRQKLGNAH